MRARQFAHRWRYTIFTALGVVVLMAIFVSEGNIIGLLLLLLLVAVALGFGIHERRKR